MSDPIIYFTVSASQGSVASACLEPRTYAFLRREADGELEKHALALFREHEALRDLSAVTLSAKRAIAPSAGTRLIQSVQAFFAAKPRYRPSYPGCSRHS